MKLTLDRTVVTPGDKLAAHLELRGPAEDREVEWTVSFFTEGKGQPDTGVFLLEQQQVPGDHVDRTLDTPIHPLSYEGTLLRIVWVVRARCDGEVAEQRFWLGREAPPRWLDDQT